MLSRDPRPCMRALWLATELGKGKGAAAASEAGGQWNPCVHAPSGVPPTPAHRLLYLASVVMFHR